MDNTTHTERQLRQEPFFERASFLEIDIHGVELDGKHFSECEFTDCNFTECVFADCSFSDCKFVNCNLSLVKIPHCQIYHTTFARCKMIGIDWTAATWRESTPRKKSIFSIRFDDCTLNYSIFMWLNLTGAKFSDCMLKEVGFESANLQDAEFRNCDLTGAIFSDTNLSKADLSTARNYSIDVRRNNVSKTKVSFPEATALVYALDLVIEG